MSTEAWQRLLGRAKAEGSATTASDSVKSGGGSDNATVEIRVLEAEVKRLRAEREAREAAERELLQELQRRCDRIIDLEVKLDEQKSAMEKLAKEREEQASYETELMSLLRDAQTPPVAEVSKASASVPTAAAQAAVASLGPAKARVLELEGERDRLVEQKARQQDEITSLTVQVKQLKQVIHQLGSTEEESTGRLPAAQAVGLSPETLTLLDKCPWSEALVRDIQVEEEAFEWQSWSIFHNWSGSPQHVKTALQGVVAEGEPLLSDVGGDSRPLTDRAARQWVRLEDVSLPGEGWEWIGGWRVDLNNGTSDADGWCYASTAEDLLEGKGGDQSLVASGKRRVRMRRWVRLRLLVRVEGLCEMACRFLAFHARVASMELLTRKLSEQVLKAQGTINDREMQASRTVALEKHVRTLQDKLSKAEKRAADLQRELAIMQNEERILKACQVPGRSKGGEPSASSSPPSSSSSSLQLLSDSSKEAMANGIAKLFGSSSSKESQPEPAAAAVPSETVPPAALSGDGGPTTSAFTRWFKREDGASPPTSEAAGKAQSKKPEDGEPPGPRMGFVSSIRWFGGPQQSEEGQKTISDDDDDETGGFSIDDVAGLVREFGELEDDAARAEPSTGEATVGDCADDEEDEEEVLRGLTPEGAKLVRDLRRASPPREEEEAPQQPPVPHGED